MTRLFNWPLEVENLRGRSRRHRERKSRFETLFMNSFRKARERMRTLV